MRIIILKNPQLIEDFWEGQSLDPNGTYQIPTETEREGFASNTKVNQDIWADPAKLIINDGEKDLDPAEADSWLKNIDNIQKEIAIQEEDIKTGGHYQASGFEILVEAGEPRGVVEVSFPFPISLLAAEWNNDPLFEGDSVEMLVGPDTIIGAITSNVNIGDKVINVSPTVIENIAIGRVLGLFSLGNSEKLGRVIEIDQENSTLTVENGSVSFYSAANPTYVRMTTEILRKTKLSGVGRVQLGESKIGGSYIPAGVVLNATYYNDTDTDKKMRFMIEYLY